MCQFLGGACLLGQDHLADDERHDEETDEDDDEGLERFGELEDLLPLIGEEVAGRDQDRVPHEAADEGEERERSERHAAEAGGDGDQGADEGYASAHENGEVGPTVEP